MYVHLLAKIPKPFSDILLIVSPDCGNGFLKYEVRENASSPVRTSASDSKDTKYGLFSKYQLTNYKP